MRAVPSVLSRSHRLTASRDFSRAVRLGMRSSSRTVVVHLAAPDDPPVAAPPPARAGVAVGRSVGSAVVRNRVKRRLRHLAADRIDSLPAGAALVVRAVPPAASATYQELGRDLDSGLDKALRRASHRPRPSRGRALAGTPRRSSPGGVP